MVAEGPIFSVGFDELALAEDLARTSAGGTEALAGLRRDVEQLGGCVKTYVPWPTGRFGAVLIPVSHRKGPVALRVIAFGVRHHPHEAHALTVYEIAHRRLHGSERSTT